MLKPWEWDQYKFDDCNPLILLWKLQSQSKASLRIDLSTFVQQQYEFSCDNSPQCTHSLHHHCCCVYLTLFSYLLYFSVWWWRDVHAIDRAAVTLDHYTVLTAWIVWSAILLPPPGGVAGTIMLVTMPLNKEDLTVVTQARYTGKPPWDRGYGRFTWSLTFCHTNVRYLQLNFMQQKVGKKPEHEVKP